MDSRNPEVGNFATLSLDELKSATRLRGLSIPCPPTKDALIDLLDRHTYINHHLTKRKPFQEEGFGRDPAALVGLKIRGVEINNKTFFGEIGNGTRLIMGPNDPVYLTLHCSTGEEVTITVTEPSRRWAAIRVDENLAKAFEGLDQNDDGDDGDGWMLEIIEAVVAKRGRIVPKSFRSVESGGVERHDVIGIRCRGMTEMGYVFCKFGSGDDVDGAPLFADVMVR